MVEKGDKLVVQLHQRERHSLHVQRGEIRSDEGAVNADAMRLQTLANTACQNVEFHRLGAAERVDEERHAIAAHRCHLAQNAVQKQIRGIIRLDDLLPHHTGFTVNADPDLHLVRTDLVTRLTGIGQPYRLQGQTHRVGTVGRPPRNDSQASSEALRSAQPPRS